MNRILKRPMFRIGGSAGTGITSGLDKSTSKNKKGTMMADLDDVRDSYSQLMFGKDVIDLTPEELEEFEMLFEMEYGGKKDGGRIGYATGTQMPSFQTQGLPGFLTSFGLNLLSTPPQGNIFQTAATAARDPFNRLQASQAAAASTAEDRAFKRQLQQELLKGQKEIAAMKQKDSFFAAQTPEEQFRERAKIYSESSIPVIKENATDLATFEVKHRGENYVQLNFEYDKKTKQFEPDFRSVPEGALTYDPGKGVAYKMTRRDDGILVPIPLNPFTLEPLENIDGSES